MAGSSAPVAQGRPYALQSDDPFGTGPRPMAPAAQQRVILFEGRRIAVPADATDDEIRQILSEPAPAVPQAPASGQPAAAPGVDTAKIKRNIRRMLDQGASEQEIDAYVAGMGATPEMLRAAPPLSAAPNPGQRLGEPIEAELFDGTILEFPPGTSREVIERVAREQTARRRQGAGKPEPTPYPEPIGPEVPMTGPGRQLMLGAQAAGRGAAKAAFGLADLANMAANVPLAGADAVASRFGGSVPFRFGSVSDRVIDGTSRAADALGVPLQNPATLGEKAMGNAIDLATQGLGGAAALTRAAAPRAAELASPGATPRLGDALLRPYFDNAGKATVGDAIAGLGAGSALTASQELVSPKVREAGGGTVGPLLDLGAMLTGGVGAATGYEVATRTPSTVASMVRGRMPARDVPYDPATGEAATNRQADAVAKYLQGNAVDPQAAADTIRRGVVEYRSMDAPLPTAGALANDPKLLPVERALRTRAPGEFAARDVALQDAARETIEGIRPQGVDPREATSFFRQQVEDKRSAAVGAQRSAEQALAGAEQAQRQTGDALRLYAGRSASASEALDRQLVEGTYLPARTAKNDAFEAIDPERARMVDASPVVAAARQIRDSVNALGPDRAQLPAEFLQRLERLAPDLQEQTVASRVLDASGNPISRTVAVNEGGSGEVALGDLIDVRKYLAKAYEEAQKSGNFDLANNVSELRRAIAGVVSQAPDAQAANRLYAEEFAPRFRGGRGDEMQRFTREIDRDPTRSTTPPTATAGRFLSTGGGAKERSAALARVVESMPDPQSATRAVREYVMADLQRTIGADGRISETSLARWLNGPSGWGDALSQFPGIRSEVEQLLGDVRRGNTRRNALATAVEDAARNRVRTEEEIGRSALSITLGKEPTKAARDVLNSNDPPVAMREIVQAIGPNRREREAWQRAVADHLVERVSSVNPAAVSDGALAIDFAKLTTAFNRYEKALGELYKGDPDKMNAIRRAQRLLEPLATRGGNAAAIPNGRDGSEFGWKVLETALKAHYGILKGGGVLRTVRIAMSLGADDPKAIERLLTRAMLDPELAAHLLTRKTAEAGTPAWNSELAKLIRRVEAGRELMGDEGESD